MMDVETADDGWQAPTVPEPLSMRFEVVGDDTDLLEGYVGIGSGDGCVLIASGAEYDATMKLTRWQMKQLAEWLVAVEAEQSAQDRVRAALTRMAELERGE